MVKYKNFGSGGSQHQTIGSFSFSSQNSQQSSKTTRTVKSGSNKSNRRNERSPSITRRNHEEDDCRDEDGSRFDPRILSKASTEEEEIKEREAESLYDMVSYNELTDEHSTSVCASFSYSNGDTDSSAGHSDPPVLVSPNTRRAKLSYMGYVPVSPNTAAAMAVAEMREHSNTETRTHSLTHRTRNSNNSNTTNSNAYNNSGHTGDAATTTDESTFPSIKVDDTSTSRRRQRDFDDDSQQQLQQQQQQHQLPTIYTNDCASPITEYTSAGQQRCLEEQKELQRGEAKNHTQQQQNQSNQKDSMTVASSSVAGHTQNGRVEDATIDTSVVSSVMPNSCTGHPAMTTNQRHQQQQEQLQLQIQQQIQHQQLSPVVASPISQHMQQTPLNRGAVASGHETWAENASLGLSPLTAGISAHGMVPPSLNHPSAMMQSHWNQQQQQQQQQHLYQHRQYEQQQQQHQLEPVQNYPNHHLPHMYPNGTSGNQQQYPMQPPQQQHQQPQQAFQSGFFPRNPVLARQLQAFHQYHNQQQQQQQPPSTPTQMPPAPALVPVSLRPEEPQERYSTETPRLHRGFEPVTPKNNGKMTSSEQSNDENSDSDHQPFLFCGPDGPQVMNMNNVKFVTPNRPNDSGSRSSHYGASYNGGALGGCAQGGMKCQSAFSSFLNTVGAIVSHGYHVDNSKSSSKEKRAKFGKIADESIAGLTKTEHSGDQGGGISGIGSGLNDALTANAKKFFHAGNNIAKDFQNLTPSAAYNNVFDTFQKYAPTGPVLSDESVGLREALSDDPDEVEAAKEPNQAPLSPISAQREHFRKLRRKRNNRTSHSPIRTSMSEPNPALSPTSPKSKTSKENELEASFENFKGRYSRNLHTKLHSQKMDKVCGPDDARETKENRSGKDPVESKEVESKNVESKGVESKDEDSHCSWSTPLTSEEASKHSLYAEPELQGDKSKSADSLEEVLGERVTGDMVLSTSSGMSDSLVGSDVDDEEPQLDSMMNSSLSEEERQEDTDTDGEDEPLLLDSFDHNEFPHTPLDVIEEGSEDEMSTVNPPSIVGIDASMDEQVLHTIPSDEWSLYESCGVHAVQPVFSVIGLFRIAFVAMIVLQCGTMVDFWDQIADHIKTVEGGQDAITATQNVISNLKASGVSLVKTAQGIINIDKIDLSAGRDILSEIESCTTALMGTTNQFLAELAAGKLEEKSIKTQEENELQLFQQLVDDALWADDDALRPEEVEETISAAADDAE